jgi:hypothetical protein
MLRTLVIFDMPIRVWVPKRDRRGVGVYRVVLAELEEQRLLSSHCLSLQGRSDLDLRVRVVSIELEWEWEFCNPERYTHRITNR